MATHAGEMCAILAALFGAGAVCFFKKSGETIPPLSLSLLRSLISTVLVSLTIPFIAEARPSGHATSDFILLLASGILMMAIGDTLFLAALNRIGVGMWAVVSCFYSPTVILMAYLVLDEKVGLMDLLGGGIIMFAIAFNAARNESGDTARKERLRGILFGVGSLLCGALGVILMKPAVERVPLLWAMEVRLIGATIVLFLMALLCRQRRVIFAALRPSAAWKFMLPGVILGGYVALGFWMAGFKFAPVTGATLLGQINILFIAVFARVFLKEALSRDKALKLAMAMVGALMVAVF